MLSLADKVVRATRFVLGIEQDELWAITVCGRVLGLLVCEAGRRRLAWLEGTDSRLTGFAGALGGDIDALAAARQSRGACNPVGLD